MVGHPGGVWRIAWWCGGNPLPHWELVPEPLQRGKEYLFLWILHGIVALNWLCPFTQGHCSSQAADFADFFPLGSVNCLLLFGALRW